MVAARDAETKAVKDAEAKVTQAANELAAVQKSISETKAKTEAKQVELASDAKELNRRESELKSTIEKIEESRKKLQVKATRSRPRIQVAGCAGAKKELEAIQKSIEELEASVANNEKSCWRSTVEMR